jgi:excisionase family DNA binding protein
MTKLLTVSEAAQHLRISRSKLYELLGPVSEGGEIKSCHIGARRMVIAQSLDEYVERLCEVEDGVG